MIFCILGNTNINIMKKKTVTSKVNENENKSMFRQAGEMIGTIGAHIMLAKDSIIDFVSDEAVVAKKATDKMAKKVKKAFKKTPIKKAGKQVVKKAKKTVKKVPLKKPVKKIAKKTVKFSKKVLSPKKKKS